MSIKDLPIEQQRQIQKGKLYALKVKRANGEELSSGVPIPQGRDGKDGQDGYTPIKGIDYFDGKDGKDGRDGKDSFVPGPQGAQGPAGKDGRDSTVPGPQGPQGEQGPKGEPGKDGVTPTVEFATGKDFDRLKINGKVQGPHLTGPSGPQGPAMTVGIAGGGTQVNSDWNATSGVEEILNKPTIPTQLSQLTNNTGILTFTYFV